MLSNNQITEVLKSMSDVYCHATNDEKHIMVELCNKHSIRHNMSFGVFEIMVVSAQFTYMIDIDRFSRSNPPTNKIPFTSYITLMNAAIDVQMKSNINDKKSQSQTQNLNMDHIKKLENIGTTVTQADQALLVNIAKQYNIPFSDLLESGTYDVLYIANGKLHGYSGYSNYSTITKIPLTDFIYKLINPKPTMVEVKLNDKHSALVTKNDITVGCQTFPITILIELNMALKSLE